MKPSLRIHHKYHNNHRIVGNHLDVSVPYMVQEDNIAILSLSIVDLPIVALKLVII